MAVTAKSPELLEEAELRSLSRNLNYLIPRHEGEAFQEYPRDSKYLLECLIFTVGLPNLALKHRAAACDTVAGVVERGVDSDSDLREACLKPSTWHALLVAYLQWSDEATKPMRNLLVTLMKVLANQDQGWATAIAREATGQCLSLIRARDDLSCVKSAMLALEMLLNKKRVSSLQVFALALTSTQDTETVSELETTSELHLNHIYQVALTDFVCSVLKWACYSHISPAVAKFLAAFFKGLNGESVVNRTDCSLPLWAPAMLKMADKDGLLLDNLQRQILPSLLRLDIDQASRSAQARVLLRSFQVDKLLATDIGSVAQRDIRFCLLVYESTRHDYNMFGLGQTSQAGSDIGLEAFSRKVRPLLLEHASPEIRIQALSSIFSGSYVPSLSSLAEDLERIFKTLPSYHSEADSRYRMEIIATLKRMFAQIAAVLMRASKAPACSTRLDTRAWYATVTAGQASEPEAMTRIVQFVIEYFGLLYAELQPSASFQRHFTALSALNHAHLLHVPEALIRTPPMMRALLDLTMDPFADVRANAATMLKDFPHDMLDHVFVSSHSSIVREGSVLDRAERMMQRSGRADYADGVGRLYDMLYGSCIFRRSRSTDNLEPSRVITHLLGTLESDISMAKQNLAVAVASAPIHGRLIALRYILSRADISQAFKALYEWRDFHNRLMCCFTQIWNIVKQVLCIDSPEGNTDYDEDEAVDIGAKDTLSYSWRTLKETSSVMQSLLENPQYGICQSLAWLEAEDYKAMGELSFTQLAELRHRGAFSTVAQTFASCCFQCACSKEHASNILPEIWYQEALRYIQEKATALTRRSAGLPALLCGILAPYRSGPFLDNVIKELQDTAITTASSEEASTNRLPQVHALNCLKDAFTNSRLTAGTEVHITHTIQIAVACFENPIWAIRNCGIMLFRALIARLAGGSGSNTVVTGSAHRRFPKALYKRHPQLAQILVQQLRRSCTIQKSLVGQDSILQIQTGFPAMEIIDRFGAPPDQAQLIGELLSDLIKSPVWNLREKAARALGTFASASDLILRIQSQLMNPETSNNEIHGLLLCLKYVLEAGSWIDQVTMPQTVSSTLSLISTALTQCRCSFTSAAYLRVLSRLLKTLESRITQAETRGESFTTTEKADILTTKFKEALGCVSGILGQIDGQTDPYVVSRVFWESLVHLQVQNAAYQSWYSTSISSGIYQWLGSEKNMSKVYTYLVAFEEYQFKCGIKELQSFLEVLGRLLTPTSPERLLAAVSLRHLTYLAEYCCEAPNSPIEETNSFFVCAQVIAVLKSDILHRVYEPSALSSALRCQGNLIRFVARYYGEAWRLEDHLHAWATRLSLALSERSEMDLRLAAVSSLHDFRTILRHAEGGTKASSEFLPVYTALYTALLDDDDEVRDIAAAAVSWVLSEPATLQSWNPVVAAERLLTFLTNTYHGSRALCEEGLYRLTGSSQWRTWVELVHRRQDSDEQKSAAIHVRCVLENALEDELSLFAEEKQNLYLDEVTEAFRWAVVLRSLSAEVYLEAPFLQVTKVWVLQGLHTLAAIAESQVDGALGWTHKADMFVAGMRVFALADVVLCWSDADTAQKIKQCLLHLRKIAKQSELHGRWQSRIESLIVE